MDLTACQADRQPRYQEALKQSPPSEACLSFHAAVLQWPTGRQHSCERMQGWASQQSSQGPRPVTLLVAGSLQGRYAWLHMVYQLSLPVVVFSLQTKNEDSETWVGWSSQPKFASDIYLIEPLGLHCLLQLSGAQHLTLLGWCLPTFKMVLWKPSGNRCY